MAESAIQQDLERDVQLLLDSTKLRHALQRNNIVQSEHEATQRHLRRECRQNLYEISREEKEVRHQLERLYVEQSSLTPRDYDDERLSRSSAYSFLDSEPGDGSRSEVTNPYPITFPTRKLSEPNKSSSKQKDTYGTGKPRSAHRRRHSVEFEDLMLVTATGKILPPSHDGKNAVGPGSLSKAGSLSPMRLHSPSDKKEFWVGAPEAISSVRRARRVGVHRPPDLLFARTPDVLKLDALRRQVLSRSQSLKGLKEPGTPVFSSSPVFGRSNSYKESARCARKGALMLESLTSLDGRGSDVGGGRTSRRTRRSPLSSTSNLRDVSLSPASSPHSDDWIQRAVDDTVTSHRVDKPSEISRDLDQAGEYPDERLFRRRHVQLRDLSNVPRSSPIPIVQLGMAEGGRPPPIGLPDMADSCRLSRSPPSYFLTEPCNTMTVQSSIRRQNSARSINQRSPDRF